VKQRREVWKGLQGFEDTNELVFLDESNAKTNMTRSHGRAKIGNRLKYPISPTWKSKTMLSSVRADGEIVCMVIDGALNGAGFKEYIKHFLLPTLHPNDLVILDNCRSHKNQEALDLITSVNAFYKFLPPYSPDLNPIENMWSKVKSILRKEEAKTDKKLMKVIKKALNSISQKDIIGWFGSCGYATE